MWTTLWCERRLRAGVFSVWLDNEPVVPWKNRCEHFYWETRSPTKVYYRIAEEKQAMNYFKLPKGVVDVDGVTKALSTNMDMGFYASRESGWLDVAPYHDTIIEVSFKNAKQVKGSQ
jgi:hypothetical protein